MIKLTTPLLGFLALAIACIASSELGAKPKQSRAERKAAEKAFLAENSKRPGVVTTKSGLQYEILKVGNGSVRPRFRQYLRIHYHSTFIDGTVMESTLNRKDPLRMRFENVIAGWKEGLRLMTVGDKYRFYIPSRLGYGPYNEGRVPGYSTLIFDIELIAIE